MAKRIILAGRSITETGRKVTGFCLPGIGLQWADPGPSEREHVRRLVVFLEDRRALYNPDYLEDESQVERSVHEIRAECTRNASRMCNTNGGRLHERRRVPRRCR